MKYTLLIILLSSCTEKFLRSEILETHQSGEIKGIENCSYAGLCCDCGIDLFGGGMDCGCGFRSHCSGKKNVSYYLTIQTQQEVYLDRSSGEEIKHPPRQVSDKHYTFNGKCN